MNLNARRFEMISKNIQVLWKIKIGFYTCHVIGLILNRGKTKQPAPLRIFVDVTNYY